MNGSKRKISGVVKGAPSGFLISLAVHAAAFLLAGMLVVFTVHQKTEKKFVPPAPVDRPKMKLKKPKVKVKKSAKPKSTTRIVTRVKRASMPDIQLPEMSGMGEGLAGQIGGFEIAPNLEEVTLFGEAKSMGNDFVGTFYDLKRTRSGNVKPVSDAEEIGAPLKKFVSSGWKTSTLAQYYQSPRKLYATSFAVPMLHADVAPEAFGEMDTGGWGWAVHYKGKLVHKDGITFRFRGSGDSVLIVRVDGEIVLDGNYYNAENGNDGFDLLGWTKWNASAAEHRQFYLANTTAAVSDWITLEPGVPLDMEILLGDVKGYGCAFMLCVEEKGVEYPISREQAGAPILPIFKTADPSRAAQDMMHAILIREQISTTNGPVFNDYQSGGNIDLSPKPILENKPESYVEGSPMRIWTAASGKTIEAEYLSTIGDKVVLKSARGKQMKIPFSELSAQDIEYIDLVNEPKFNITFVKKSRANPRMSTSRYTLETENHTPPYILEWTFGAKLEQTSSRPYNQELKVEYFAIGVQVNDRNKFILVDRGESSFVPTKENNRSHQFGGTNPIELIVNVNQFENTGRKYDGNLVVVTDQRGKIIAHSGSEWLLELVDALRVLPLNAYFDKEGRRVLPTNTVTNRQY